METLQISQAFLLHIGDNSSSVVNFKSVLQHDEKLFHLSLKGISLAFPAPLLSLDKAKTPRDWLFLSSEAQGDIKLVPHHTLKDRAKGTRTIGCEQD